MLNYTDASITTVDGNFTVSDDPINVVDGSEWPASDFTVKVWDQTDPKVLKAVILVGTRTGNALTSLTWNYGGHTDANIADGDYIALGVAAPQAPSLALIERQLLTATTASFDFQNIPNTWESLKIVLQARGTHTTGNNLLMRFNNDSGNNYAWQYTERNSTTTGGSRATGQNAGIVAFIPGTDATANKASISETIIPNYKRTTFHKEFRAQINNWLGTAGPAVVDFVGDWANTAAITRVTLVPTSASLAAGSVASLYGIR